MRSFKRFVLDVLARANYSIVHADQLVREREEAGATAQRLQLLQSELLPRDEGSASAPRDAFKIEVRPLARMDDLSEPALIDGEWARKITASDLFKKVTIEFGKYPRHSYVTDVERAFLYCLILRMRPDVVVEIGTAFCGTSEIIARALWENGRGLLHTTDPFGGERCPPIIEQWPEPLQKFVRFYDKSSMDFFATIDGAGIRADIAFIDGNHDFEFAYFDILMAARLLRPGGILIVDNAEQTGPFYAATEFVRHNPDWVELGGAIAESSAANPFTMERSTIPHGRFLAIKAPHSYLIGRVPRSTGQVPSPARVAGFVCQVVGDPRPGMLHYQVILRAFRDQNREIKEYRSIGQFPVERTTLSGEIVHPLVEPLVSVLHDAHGDCTHTLEIELAWRGRDGDSEIRFAAAPMPLTALPAHFEAGWEQRAHHERNILSHPPSSAETSSLTRR